MRTGESARCCNNTSRCNICPLPQRAHVRAPDCAFESLHDVANDVVFIAATAEVDGLLFVISITLIASPNDWYVKGNHNAKWGTRRHARRKRQVSISKRGWEKVIKVHIGIGSFVFLSPRKDPPWLRSIDTEILSSKLHPFDYSTRKKRGIVRVARAHSSDTRIPRTCTYFGLGACACRWQCTMAETVFRSPSPFHRELESQDTLVALRFCELQFSGGEYGRPKRAH